MDMMGNISFEHILDHLYDGVYVVDRSRRITFWNKAAERITGFTGAETVGSSCADNLLQHTDGRGNILCATACPLSASMEDGNAREAQVFLHHKLGHRVPVSVKVSPVRDRTGTVVGAVEIFTDNSDILKILEDLERARREAYVDALTGIANRRYGEMVIRARLSDQKALNTPFGVIMFDIDHFKDVNDTYGHHVGDVILTMVANTARSVVRKMDTVCRWGGEEFVAVLPHVDESTLSGRAELIRLLVEQSYIVDRGSRVSVTVSLGATVARAGDTAQTVVDRADRLMYASKRAGRNRTTTDGGPTPGDQARSAGKDGEG